MSEVLYSVVNVQDGRELGSTPQVAVQAIRRRGSPPETLVLFFDVNRPSAQLCGDLTHVFAGAFMRAAGGLTTTLRLAFKMANDRLVELNRGSPNPVHGSMTCAMVEGNRVIVAQAGPAVAFARSADGAFETFLPTQSSTEVGSSHAIEITFHNIAAQPKDSFVLTGSLSMTDVPDKLVEACMAKGDPQMVAGYLNANVKTGHMVAAAFAVTDAATKGAPQPKPVTAPADAAPSRVASRSAPSTPRRPERASSPDRKPISATLAPVVAGLAAAAGSVFGRLRSGAKTTARAASQTARRGLSEIGGQLLPEPIVTTPKQRSKAMLFALGLAAVLLPILVGGAVAAGYLQLSGEADRQQQLNVIKAQFERARAANDASEWAKTLDLARSFESQFVASEQVGAVKQQARAELDKLTGVTRVAVIKLVEFATPSSSRRIAAASLGVYALDAAVGDVDYFSLSTDRASVTGRPVPIVSTAATAGAPRFKDVTWATASGNRWRAEGAVFAGSDLMGDYGLSTGQLVAGRVPTGTDGAATDVTAVDLFGDQAYLLDTAVGQIYRVRNDGGSFTRLASYFRSPYNPLKDSADIAIDGSVYILQRNGTVLKYLASQPIAFPLSKLPEPVTKPVAIAVSGPNREQGGVFVADGAKASVYQFTKVGEFVRQFRAANEEFADIVDLSIDPTSNIAYVATSTGLFSFRLPQ